MDIFETTDVLLPMSRVRLKNEWIEFLVAQEYTHAVTFKPNPDENRLRLADLHRLFVKVHMLADRAMFCGRYLKASKAHQRSPAVGIVEGLPFNGHLHGAFKIIPRNFEKFEQRFVDGTLANRRANIWRKLMPSGTCAIERIDRPDGWHRYTFKHVWQTDDTDRLVFLPLSLPLN